MHPCTSELPLITSPSLLPAPFIHQLLPSIQLLTPSFKVSLSFLLSYSLALYLSSSLPLGHKTAWLHSSSFHFAPKFLSSLLVIGHPCSWDPALSKPAVLSRSPYFLLPSAFIFSAHSPVPPISPSLHPSPSSFSSPRPFLSRTTFKNSVFSRWRKMVSHQTQSLHTCKYLNSERPPKAKSKLQIYIL